MTPKRLAEIKARLGQRGVVALGTERQVYQTDAPELLAEVERLRLALEKALTVGLPPHDVSGCRMWEEARAALNSPLPQLSR